MLSEVTIVRQNGLGKSAARDDGTAGIVADAVAIDGRVAIGTPIMVTSLAELESKGVTKAYDLTNKVLLWHHVRDFYLGAGKGTKLYVMPVAKQTEMVDVLDTSQGAAAKLLTYAKGAVRLLAVASMSEPFTSLTTNVTAAQALFTWAAARNKAVQILLEGRAFPAEYTAAPSLREMTANRVSVVISQDPSVAAEDAAYGSYAQVGLLLGTLSGIPVSRDAGRVRSGSISVAASGISNGRADGDVGYYDDDQLSAIDDLGYLFLRTYDGMSGYFWNADYTAVSATDDCDTIRMGRTLDKAADLARLKALESLRDDVEIDTSTGYISVDVLHNIQADIETAVLTQMTDEISGVQCVIDPEQSLWDSSNPLVVDLEIVARGVIARIQIPVYYVTQLSDD